MRYAIYAFLLTAAAAFATPAAAAKYKCNCFKQAVEDLESSPDVKINCVDTYTDFDSHASVQEKKLKVKVSGGNKTQSDGDMEIQFRPRDSLDCLWSVDDGNAKKNRWGGTYCNTGSYKKVHPFTFKEKNGAINATYQASLTSRKYTGLAIFTKQADGKKYMQAICIEDK